MDQHLTYRELINAEGTLLKSGMIIGELPHVGGVFEHPTLGNLFVVESTVPGKGGQHFKLATGGYEHKYKLQGMGLPAGKDFMVMKTSPTGELNILVPKEAPAGFDDIGHAHSNKHGPVLAGLDAAFRELEDMVNVGALTDGMKDMRLTKQGVRVTKTTVGAFSPVRVSGRVPVGNLPKKAEAALGVVPPPQYAYAGDVNGVGAWVKQAPGELIGFAPNAVISNVGTELHIPMRAKTVPPGGVKMVPAEKVPTGDLRISTHGFIENRDHPALAGINDALNEEPLGTLEELDRSLQFDDGSGYNDRRPGLGALVDGFGAPKPAAKQAGMRLPTTRERLPVGALGVPMSFQLS